MKYLQLIQFHKRHFSRSASCYLNTDIWKKNLDLEIRKEIEDYWRKQFKYDNLFDENNSKEKYYVLSMFPYPSGNLHMGHVRVYTISDTIARFNRMNGKNPMGWDAFGLPAENAAFERGIAPQEWTKQNIEQMRTQFKKLSCTFDWKYELATCDPKYYRWTQYIFLKMYEAGLVYQKEALVNWDPVDETVLANEQVDEDGRSWRSGAKVEKIILKQWFIKTTKFAKELYEGLNDTSLINWRDIFAVQRNWIGECNGYSFELKFNSSDNESSLNVWVQDPLSILKAEFVVVKPDSMADIMSGGGCSERQLDLKVVNPFTNEVLPVFVSEQIEFPFGRDVYVGVPSNVEADKEFALSKGLELKSFIDSNAEFNTDNICDKAQKLGIGGYPVSSKLSDWLISRQRYWGTPIPMVHCEKCGSQPVPYDKLPVTLPTLPENLPVGKAVNQFLKESSWKETECPKCGGKATRETDTMDTFVDSSWYYLRYVENNNDDKPFSDISNQLMPVDIYIGGKEHAVLHLYYARFVSYFLNSINLTKFREPFQRLLSQGMVKGKTFTDKEGKFFKPSEVQIQGNKFLSKESGEELIVSWEKMSKSKYNGVEPTEILDLYGVDTTRLFLLFSVAPMSHRNWDSTLFPDVLIWQNRLWLTIREFLKVRETPLESQLPGFDLGKEDEKLRNVRQKYVRMATYNFSHTHQLAAAFTNLQGLTKILRAASREVRKFSKEYERCMAAFIIMLTPLAPHFAATLWFGFTSAPGRLNVDNNEISWDENVTKQKWPKLDLDQIVPFSIRINSHKTKYVLNLKFSTFNELNLEDAVDYALMHPTVRNYVDRKDIIDVEFEKIENFGANINLIVENQRYEEYGNFLKEKATESTN